MKTSSKETLVAEAITTLTAARPPDFVATRNTLTKMLTSAGHTEAAKELAARKRPSWATWAIAAISREEPDLIATLTKAGATFAQATSTATTKPANVRAKQSEYSMALGVATRSALDRLGRAGQKAAATAHLRDVRAGLRDLALAGASGLPDVSAVSAASHEADQMHKKHLDQLHTAITKAERALGRADDAQKKAEARLREADAVRDGAQRDLAAAKQALAAAMR